MALCQIFHKYWNRNYDPNEDLNMEHAKQNIVMQGQLLCAENLSQSEETNSKVCILIGCAFASTFYCRHQTSSDLHQAKQEGILSVRP